MSKDPGEPIANAEAEFLRALLAIEEEIRHSSPAAQMATTHSTVDNPTPTEVDSATDAMSANRLEKLRRTLELLNCVKGSEPKIPVSGDALEPLDEFRLPPRYEVVTQLGQGGFGTVVLAFDRHLKRRVAIKLPKPDLLLTKRMLARFLREAQHVAQLDHPNIIPVLGTDESAPLPFIVYHYCQGYTLAQWLSHQRDPIGCRQAVHIVVLLAEAIHHAHQRGILHRDLKPSNILLETAADKESRHGFHDGQSVTIPRITDFGISKVFNDASAETNSDATTVGMIVGTLHYMAPEQIRGQQSDVGWHSDVYSLGVILYELLTRQRPFVGETSAELLMQMNANEVRLRRLRPDVSRDLEAIVQRALGLKVENRYASALELAEDLHAYLDGRAVTARPQSAWSRVHRWALRQPVVATLSVLCCLLVIVASFMGVSYFRQMRLLLATTAAVNRDLTKANSRVRAARDQATQLAYELSQQLYTADMAAAADALRKKDILRYQPIMDKYLPAASGQPGESSTAGAAEVNPDIVEHALLRDAAWHYLWNVGHRQGSVITTSAKPIFHLGVSSSQNMLAVCGGDGLVKLIDTRSLAELRSWPATQGELRCASFSNDDQLIASLGERGSVCVWKTSTGELLNRFETKAKQAYQLVWQDDDTLITTGNDPIVHIWNWRTGEETGQLARHSRGIEGLAITSDRQTLVSAGDDGATHVWNLRDKSLAYSLEHTPARVTDVVVCPDKPWIFTCDILGRSRRLTLTPNPNTHSFITDSLKAAESIACSQDGRRLATGTREGIILLADIDPAGERMLSPTEIGEAWQGHQGRINDMVFIAGGQWLFSAGQDGKLMRWSMRSTTNNRIDLTASTHGTHAAYFVSETEDDNCLVCNTDKLFRWDPSLSQLEPLGVIPAHAQGMVSTAGSDLVFINDNQARISAWRVPHRDANSKIQEIWNHQCDEKVTVYGLAFSPQRNLLVAATDEPGKPLRVFDAKTGQPGPDWWVHPELNIGARHVAFSPNGSKLAASYGKRIGLWDMDSGEATILSGHTDTVSSLAFHPNSQLLASGGEDRCIRVWDKHGEQLKELRHHQDEIRSVLFAPDGKSLVSSDRGGQTLIWKVENLTLSLELDKRVGEVILPNTWRGKNLYRICSHHWLVGDTITSTEASATHAVNSDSGIGHP